MRIRIATSGRFALPEDFATPAPIGRVLTVGPSGVIWSDPTFTPIVRITETFSVTIPELAAQERGHVSISTIGTSLEGITPGMPLLVDALAESMPAGGNNGMYITCRISATSEIRLYFLGKITSKVLPYLCTVFL